MVPAMVLTVQKMRVVPGVGLEPTLPKERDFESLASTNFATRAGRRTV